MIVKAANVDAAACRIEERRSSVARKMPEGGIIEEIAAEVVARRDARIAKIGFHAPQAQGMDIIVRADALRRLHAGQDRCELPLPSVVTADTFTFAIEPVGPRL